MTSLAFILILIAAFVHATWNFLAKHAGGGAAFVWLFTALSALIYLPLALFIIFVQQPTLNKTALLFMCGGTGLELILTLKFLGKGR